MQLTEQESCCKLLPPCRISCSGVVRLSKWHFEPSLSHEARNIRRSSALLVMCRAVSVLIACSSPQTQFTTAVRCGYDVHLSRAPIMGCTGLPACIQAICQPPDTICELAVPNIRGSPLPERHEY